MNHTAHSEDQTNPLLSVVMPMHNAKGFVLETLDSIKKQTLANFEVVCVDDGSIDETPEIVEAYCASDDRFRVLRKVQEGAGQARNMGLTQCTGEYVLFLDADDLFAPEMFESMIKKACTTNADICICEYQSFDSQTGEICERITIPNEISEDENVRETQSYRLFQITNAAVWNKLYRREFLVKEHAQFQNLPASNDTYFCLTTLFKAQRVYVLHHAFVSYRINSGISIRDNMDDDKDLCLLVAMQTIVEEVQNDPRMDKETAISLDVAQIWAADVTLELLVAHSYDVETALSLIKSSLRWDKIGWRDLRRRLSLNRTIRYGCFASARPKGLAWAYSALDASRTPTRKERLLFRARLTISGLLGKLSS